MLVGLGLLHRVLSALPLRLPYLTYPYLTLPNLTLPTSRYFTLPYLTLGNGMELTQAVEKVDASYRCRYRSLGRWLR